MKLSTCSCLMACIFSASQVLANTVRSPAPISATGLDALTPEYTPFPEVVDDGPALELRQNLGQDPNVGASAPAQVPPVTIYTIGSQVGSTAVQTASAFPQTFAAVPDQYPAARAGVIGYGTDAKAKREAQPVNTVTVTWPLVMAMETVFVTQPVQRVTQVVVVENVTKRNHTTMNETATARNNTRPGSIGTQMPVLLRTASAPRRPFLNPSVGFGDQKQVRH